MILVGEAEFKARMVADVPLGIVLGTRIFTTQEAGPLGITQETTPIAYLNGFILPSAMVHERADTPDNQVRDYEAQLSSSVRVVELYFYQDRGFDKIRLALARCFVLFEGHIFMNTFEATWVGTVALPPDVGSLSGASVVRQEWRLTGV